MNIAAITITAPTIIAIKIIHQFAESGEHFLSSILKPSWHYKHSEPSWVHNSQAYILLEHTEH